MSNCVTMPNIVVIRQTVVDISRIWIFQDGGSHHLGFLNFKFLTMGTVKRVELHQCAKFSQNRSNRGRDMAIFRFFKMAAVRHVGFVMRVSGLLIWWTLSPCKFCWNRCSSFDNMHVFRFRKFGLKTPTLVFFGLFDPLNREQYKKSQKAHPYASPGRLSHHA